MFSYEALQQMLADQQEEKERIRKLGLVSPTGQPQQPLPLPEPEAQSLLKKTAGAGLGALHFVGLDAGKDLRRPCPPGSAGRQAR